LIVFGCGNISSLRLQLVVARYLRQAAYEIGFVVWTEESGLPPYRREIGSLGECRALGRPPPAQPPTRKGEEGVVLQWRDFHRMAIEQAKSQLITLSPSAVVVSEDSLSANLHFLQAAKELKLRIVDVPYGYGFKADLETDLAVKERRGELLRPNGSWEARMRSTAPNWIKTGPFAGATMFPPRYILGLHAAGVRLSDPWSIHGGLADILVVESERARKRYEADGVPPAKIHVAGSPYCDLMLHSAQQEQAALAALRKPHRIESGKTRFLVSWVPDYHDGGRAHLNEFASYGEMTLSVLRQLRDLPNAAVTVSLHPACPQPTAELLRSEGFEVTPEYVIKLIPRHDAFVTSFSSTIRWPLACGKPVLNYDAYGWELQTFSSPGFFNSRRSSDVIARARELTTDEGFRAAAAEQCKRADEWGMLDGQCCARIERLLAPRWTRWLSYFIPLGTKGPRSGQSEPPAPSRKPGV
jgi:hypothetical protein